MSVTTTLATFFPSTGVIVLFEPFFPVPVIFSTAFDEFEVVETNGKYTTNDEFDIWAYTSKEQFSCKIKDGKILWSIWFYKNGGF